MLPILPAFRAMQQHHATKEQEWSWKVKPGHIKAIFQSYVKKMELYQNINSAVGGLAKPGYHLSSLPWWLCWRTPILHWQTYQYRKWRIHFLKKKLKDHDWKEIGYDLDSTCLWTPPPTGHGETVAKNLGHENLELIDYVDRPNLPSLSTSNFGEAYPKSTPRRQPERDIAALRLMLWTGNTPSAYLWH